MVSIQSDSASQYDFWRDGGLWAVDGPVGSWVAKVKLTRNAQTADWPRALPGLGRSWPDGARDATDITFGPYRGHRGHMTDARKRSDGLWPRWFRYGVMKEAPQFGRRPLCILN